MTIAQKTPFQETINKFARNKINDAFQLVGRRLPASVVSVSGSIVTVKFEVQSTFTLPHVTMPIEGSEYVRLPIQPGCKGYVQTADASLGAMSGLGAGIADLTQPANLAALVFVPIGNQDWASFDGDVLTMYGVDGLTLMDKVDGTTSVVLTSNSLTLTAAGHSIIINSSGVTIDGKLFLAHEHSGVTTGAGNTGGVV